MNLEEFDIEFLVQKLSENMQSPLFARLADIYLTTEKTDDALKLCEEGIKVHPRYYAGYLVLGKTHLALKEYSKARTAFEQAHTLSPFNAAITKLIASVPDQPDESTRTTDENYFAPSPGQPESAQIEAEQQQDQAQFESPTAEEMGFTQSAAEIDTAIAVEQHSETMEQDLSESSSQKTFPPFDEYLAQHQSQAQAGSISTLDEYLAGNVQQSPLQQEQTIQEDPSISEAVSEPPVEVSEVPTEQSVSEEHQTPEPVFSSPEQAQLFAEMAGETLPAEELPGSTSNIDEIAEKLQNVERIIPEENYQPQTSQAEETRSYETDMVTPTLAEIYASQGEFNAAIQAYEILVFSQPAKAAEFQKRIRELQQKQMEKDGLI